ncbi:MAG TPA: cytochrome c peroxidase [Candidatus Binatia bacterium]|nr:cytochrome c peroxidase [Candidatus Binatia bacterium]
MAGGDLNPQQSSRQLARLAVAAAGIALALGSMQPERGWSAAEVATLRSLWIESLPSPPPDPSNRVADDARAAEFGRKLFFDSRLSANGYVSCATCHRPDREFQDGLALGRGMRQTKRRTQTLIGVAYNPSLFWDARKDSLWSQALEPLESPSEHGGHRFRCARTIAYHYRSDYELLFGPLPAVDWTKSWDDLADAEPSAVTRVFVNAGKAIAAYERTLLPKATRFDAYVRAILTGNHEAERVLTPAEVVGLKLFVGSAGCAGCHNTPLFTDHRLHNTGVPQTRNPEPDRGAADGWLRRLDDEFRCDRRWSDVRRCSNADAAQFQPGAFKTPPLRHAARRGPFMHAGQYATLVDVIDHYSTAPPAAVGTSELQPRYFNETERRQLIAFLGTLDD